MKKLGPYAKNIFIKLFYMQDTSHKVLNYLVFYSYF